MGRLIILREYRQGQIVVIITLLHQTVTTVTLRLYKYRSDGHFHPTTLPQVHIIMPFQPSRLGLHFEIMTVAASEDSSRSFLMTKQILKSSQNCGTCHNPMVLSPCTATKSADLYICENPL